MTATTYQNGIEIRPNILSRNKIYIQSACRMEAEWLSRIVIGRSFNWSQLDWIEASHAIVYSSLHNHIHLKRMSYVLVPVLVLVLACSYIVHSARISHKHETQSAAHVYLFIIHRSHFISFFAETITFWDALDTHTHNNTHNLCLYVCARAFVCMFAQSIKRFNLSSDKISHGRYENWTIRGCKNFVYFRLSLSLCLSLLAHPLKIADSVRFKKQTILPIFFRFDRTDWEPIVCDWRWYTSVYSSFFPHNLYFFLSQ